MAPAAEGFGGDVVFSWKPNPALLSTGRFDEEAVRATLTDGLAACRANGCVVEIVMKDLQTVRGDPSRISRFVELGREAIDEVYG